MIFTLALHPVKLIVSTFLVSLLTRLKWEFIAKYYYTYFMNLLNLQRVLETQELQTTCERMGLSIPVASKKRTPAWCYVWEEISCI